MFCRPDPCRCCHQQQASRHCQALGARLCLFWLAQSESHQVCAQVTSIMPACRHCVVRQHARRVFGSSTTMLLTNLLHLVVKEAHSIAPGPGSAYSIQQTSHFTDISSPELPEVWLQQCLGSLSTHLLTSTAVCQVLPSCHKSVAMVDNPAHPHKCCHCICVRLTGSN